MPVQLNIGLNKKVGEANYGSRGASVNLEVELDSGVVDDPDRLRTQIHKLFGLARQSLHAELHGDDNNGHSNDSHGSGHHSTNGNGNGNGFDRYRVNGHSSNDGNGRSTNGRNPRQATSSQVKAIHAIAGKRIDVSRLVKDRFNVQRPDDLSISDASTLIDELKAAQSEASR